MIDVSTAPGLATFYAYLQGQNELLPETSCYVSLKMEHERQDRTRMFH